MFSEPQPRALTTQSQDVLLQIPLSHPFNR